MAGSTEIGRAHVTVSADTQPLEAGLASARSAIGSWANSIATGILQGVGQQLFQSITQGLRGAVGVIQDSVKDASDLTESISKVGVAFGESAQDILDWSKDSATALGQSQQQALEAASSFGLLFRSMGLSTDASADMSKALVGLASDIASINNIGVDEALTKLRAGLVGESEPLRTVGVLLNEQIVAQEAVKLGLAETTNAVDDQAKVLARYQLILDQTALTQGDFGRTSEQLANSQRILDAQLTNLSATLGSAFEPIQLAFTQGLSDLIILVKPYAINILRSFADGLADGIEAILPVLVQIRQLFTYWLKPGSPPRILPDLDKWGKEAAQVYLDSWGTADFASLKQLGGVIEQILRSFVASGQVGETDLVKRIFGSQRAIGDAINEFNKLGLVSADTFARIARESGPAGDKISDLVREYFNLAQAAKGVEAAQNDLNKVTQKYADALNPINAQLDAVRRKQQEIRDQERLQELGKTLTDPTATVDEKQLARLEIQQNELEKQASAIEKERDTAVGASEDKMASAKAKEAAHQAKLDAAQAALDQQVKTNSLIGEEIDLRTRLANEALAAQQKALRELEQAQREAEAADKDRLAQLERIHQAQLGFQLASTDTAGQLALLQRELANTVEGSAEYYNILTRIVGLQNKLKDEQGTGDGLTKGVQEAGDAAKETFPEFQRLGQLVKEALDTLSGKANSGEVKLNPAFQSFADAIGTIKEVIEKAQPIIEGFINLVLGKNVPELETGSDPFGDNFWLKGFIPGVNFIINELNLLRQGKWQDAWDGFKGAIEGLRDSIDPNEDPSSFGFYSWIVDTLLPAIDALATGDWKTAILKLEQPFVDWLDRAFSEGFDTIDKWWQGVTSWFETKGKAAGDWLQDKLHEMAPNIFDDPNTAPSLPKGGKGPQDSLPQSPFASFPGFTPGTPSLAASGALNTAQTTNIFYISQTIGASGDFGGARQGASDGLKQALLGSNVT